MKREIKELLETLHEHGGFMKHMVAERTFEFEDITAARKAGLIRNRAGRIQLTDEGRAAISTGDHADG